MSDERKKPGVAFWTTVALVVVLVGYPLSIGPAIWITDNVSFPDLVGCYQRFHAPMIWLYGNGPETIHDVLDWYGHLWY